MRSESSAHPADVAALGLTPRLGWLLCSLAAVLALAAPPDYTSRVSDGVLRDDFPAIACSPQQRKTVAWIAHDPDGPRDLLKVSTKEPSGWPNTETLDLPQDDLYRVALAYQPDGTLWAVWAAQVDGNWDLFTARRTGTGWEPFERLTSDPGADIHQRLATDSHGTVWMVWQAWRGAGFDILLQPIAPRGEAMVVTDDPANDWQPDIATDRQGRVHVAWDTYRDGSYDVWLRTVVGGELNDPRPIAASDRFEAHVSLAVDATDRLWLAYDDGGPGWGQDMPGDGGWSTGAWRSATKGQPKPDDPVGNVAKIQRMGGLHRVERIEIRCFDGTRLSQAAAEFNTTLPDAWQRAVELPKLSFDGRGRLWCFFRFNPKEVDNGQFSRRLRVWLAAARVYDGTGWSEPSELPEAGGRNDQVLEAATDPQGRVWFAWGSDLRTVQRPGPKGNVVRVGRFDPPDVPATDLQLEPVDLVQEAADIPRPQPYSIELGGQRLELLRGDTHRHTELSGDGVWDGAVLDMYRYALDAAKLDFVCTGDHDYGNDPLFWWLTQKWADIFDEPGQFTAFQSYERSLVFPNGHRNVLLLDRGMKVVPRAKDGKEIRRDDEVQLWQALPRGRAVTIPHTIATSHGTDWLYADAGMEPVMEIYQGCRNAYELPGGPKGDQSKPAGMAQTALAKGYRTGFIASSDHRSTHISYANVFSAERSRAGLLQGLLARHAYASTDTMIVDVRAGEQLMGEDVRGTAAATLAIKAIGTGPLARIEVIRDGKIVFATEPGTATAELSWQDNEPVDGERYYYVRVTQEDEQIAWSTPLWFAGA